MLVGIAKLASTGQVLEAKKRVQYRELPSRTWINRCMSDRVPFQWTINPYRGCEFGCKYCYARYTHEFMELREPEDFETKIFAKQLDPLKFTCELKKIPKRDEIALGTATDPWQPAEKRYGLTRKVLGVFARERGRSLSTITKSDLCARDADLLAEISRHNRLVASVTVTTCDTSLARRLEPYAPRPDLRLCAAADLARAGVEVGVFASPVLPGFNDSMESLESVASGAAAAGVRYFGAQPLFLKPCSKAVMFPFLDEEEPALAGKYRRWFAGGAYLRSQFEEELKEKVSILRERYGLERRRMEHVPPDEPQLSLFEDLSFTPPV